MVEANKQIDLFDLGYIAQKEHRFRKAWGQNFLRYSKDADRLLQSIALPEKTIVIEIGAGGGALTEALLKRHFHVIAFEIDLSLKDFLLQRFQSAIKDGHLQLLFIDALKLDWQDYLKQYKEIAVISNLPYSSTRELILKIFQEVGDKLQLLALMLQTEAIERLLAASPNESNYQSKLYGPQAVFSHLLFKKVACEKIASSAFYPIPKVSNSFVVLQRNEAEFANLYSQLLENGIEPSAFFSFFAKFLQSAFSKRRKHLVNNLLEYETASYLLELLANLQFSPVVRAEELQPRQLFNLAIAMYNKENGKSD